MSRLPPLPVLTWRPDGAPSAENFGDIYFSTEGGLSESEAVFLRGCSLPQAWAGRRRFAICELGFGTGLNALAVWRSWRSSRPAHALLHMWTVESHLMERADAARALAAFPEVAPLAEQMLAQWPVRVYAPQRLWFPDDGFTLTVHVGEAEAALKGLVGNFDAFFLDGFAPARNAAMWSPAVFAELARLAAPDARLATFTVAGDVRRGLEAAGFTAEKKPGFGRKRERLEVRRREPAPSAHPLYPYQASHPKRVAIIGAGIAGAACAAALAQRGAETIVLEAARDLGAGASGNPAGIVMPRLDRGDGPMRELFLAAYLAAVRAYHELGVFEPCGVEQRLDEALAEMLGDPPLPADWLAPSPSGVLHPRAGMVKPLEAIRAWLHRTTLLCESPVAALEQTGDAWLLRAPDTRALLKADAVVIASGASLAAFEPAAFLPLRLTQGQVDWAPVEDPPRHAIVDGHYLAPFDNGVIFGATFDRVPSPAPPITSADATQRNLDALAALAPEIAARLNRDKLNARAALRASTPDHAPIAGLLPDAPKWRERFAVLAHGAAPDLSLPAPAYNGLYVLGGLGARGLTLAPLLAERIASEMFGEPQTLSAKTLDAIHPARFLHRALKRGD